MSRLWDRPEADQTDEAILRLTTGRDPELDLELVPFDALASAAHATMLAGIGILEKAELESLRGELDRIARAARDGRFQIQLEEEDGHTAIENLLTERLGDAGRRIHTGRSRNDQVIAALRLWGREEILEAAAGTAEVARLLSVLAREHSRTSMPGYSHTRQAMPTTLGHLFAAHAESLIDDLSWLRTTFHHLNRSPLGSASGFGVALPLDRQAVSDRLGFDSVQRNTLAVQNDRGRSEGLALGAVGAILGDLGRLAADLILFSTDELRWISLADSVTTGSSIMPQKRNPDVLEIVRASGTRVHAFQVQVQGLSAGLISGYHRDLQLTKEPFLTGLRLANDCLVAMASVLASVEVDRERCKAAVRRATAATDAVYERVRDGQPFRTAYLEVAKAPEEPSCPRSW